MLVQRTLTMPAAWLAAGLVVALTAPATANADWHVRDLAGGQKAWPAAVVALPGGGTATVLDILHGREHRLVVRYPGRSTRTLLTAEHSFQPSVAADAHGHLAVAFTVIPRGRSFRRAYLWTGGAVRALTDGTRHAEAEVAASPDGHLALAVTDGSTRSGLTWVRRGTFRSGLGPAMATGVAAGAGWRDVTTSATSVALAGAAPATEGGGMQNAVAAASGSTAPFGMPSILSPVAPVSGQMAVRGPVTVGLTADGDVVAASTTISCTPGTGDMIGECLRATSAVLQVWQWRAGERAPGGDGVVGNTAAFAQRPAVHRSGSRTWLTWIEGTSFKPSVLAAARVGRGGLGAIRRLRLVDGELPEVVQAAPTAHGGLRFYLPVVARPSGALRTVVLSPDGRFGRRETVVRGPRFAGANTMNTPDPAIGTVRDLIAWSVWNHGPRAWSAARR